jgi:hypothetical protein
MTRESTVGHSTITTALRPVDEFARAVRAALSDLPADEVDDLTDGLEADLAERASDQDSPDFGDPAAYAYELRTAAGVPFRNPPSSLAYATGILRNGGLHALATLRSNRAFAAAFGFFASLQPVWWVYRGWAVFLWFEFGLGGVIHPLPATLGGVLVFIPSVLLSVQFGRDRWLPWRWMRVVLALVNIALAVATPFIAGWAINASAWR